MALPVYDPGGTRQTNPFRAPQVSADDFGGMQARALANAGQTIQQVGGKMMAIEDEQRQRDAAAKIMSAPVSVIVAMDMQFHEQLPWLFPHADARSWFSGNDALREKSAFLNTMLQAGYFIMAARAMGLDTGPMSGFDPDKLNAAFFGDRPHVKVNFISTFGHGDPSTIFGRLPRPDFDAFNRIA